MTRTKNAETIKTTPAEVKLQSDGSIDLEQIADINLRSQIETLIADQKRKEEALKEEVAKVKAELAAARRTRDYSTLAPSRQWTVFVYDLVESIEDANAAPLTKRQKTVLNKTIRLICREISGHFSVSKKYPEELELMKVAANQITKLIKEFGIPEETDHTYKLISEKKIRRARK